MHWRIMRSNSVIISAIAAMMWFFMADFAAAQGALRGPSSLRPVDITQKTEPPGFMAKTLRQLIDIQRQMVRELGRYMADIKEGSGTAAIWIGIWFAFIYGAVHAVGPGHGKLVVASYFVGREAKVWRGIAMGFQIAVTHVVAAVIMVWLVDISFRHFIGGSPAQSIWIRIVSYGVIALIGIYMLGHAIRNAWMAKRFGFHHLNNSDHHHHHASKNDSHDLRQQSFLALIAGFVPCTGAVLVMLFALANGIVGAGVILVAAISVGMALTMSAFGVFSILFRRLVMNFLGSNSLGAAIASSILEHLGGLLILLVGLSFLFATLME